MPNWNEILTEINAYIAANAGNPAQHVQALDVIRRKYIKALHDHTGRNVIAYYSGFLSKTDVSGVGINDEDKNGFMMAVHRMPRKKGLDLLLHTPGGDCRYPVHCQLPSQDVWQRHPRHRATDSNVRRNDDGMFLPTNHHGIPLQPWPN